MKVGEAGEAFFVFETDHQVPEEFQTSPLLQASPDNRSDIEEPPFLDISERKDSKDVIPPNDNFEDDEEEDDKVKDHTPPELQSPKMIIDEHMDKVVTKVYKEEETKDTKNTIYTMDDGSTMLEREVPEPITTTTIAKERFIVRPLNGDIASQWMDVTHTFAQDPNFDLSAQESSPTVTSATTINKPTEAIHGETESIVLDMSGYKTGKKEREALEEEKVHADTENLPEDIQKKSTWGWGKTHADEQVVPTTHDDKTVQLISGQSYRIEMSLCGFTAFGYDEDENNLLFKDKQLSYQDFVYNPSILNDPRLVFRYDNHYFAAVHTNSLFTSLLVFKQPLEDDKTISNKVSDNRETYSYGRGWRQWLSRSSSADPIPSVEDSSEPTLHEKDSEGERTTFTTTTKATSVGWSPDGPENDIFVKRKMYAKTLRLTSDQLKNLNLKKGVNTISFSVNSAYQGTATCVAKVFFWDYDIQVVISDIDGTITKSDAMGHLMTMIGKDWTHAGVAQLYTDIANNGYQFLYLTSRAIGQADYTRDYLKKILQGHYQLPDGPVIMSPDRLFTSLHREVIIRKPEMFKMACLKDIQRLFGGRDPFYAGFGNRITDAISYRSVNVPSSRIFTIDPQGNVKLELVTGFRSSYVYLNDLVDQIFPPINKTINEEFNDYNYWKAPIANIEIPELEDESPIPTSPKPKPIKPDPSSLPRESVVGYTPPRRGLLSSFTSRRSSNASYARPSRSSSVSSVTSASSTKKPTAVILPLKKVLSSTSLNSPILDSTAEEDETNSDVASVRSLPASLPTHHPTEEALNLPPPSTQKLSSPSIMRKVIGGVFSRRSQAKPDEKSSPEQEEEEDDLFNPDIDDLDLDKIPFI
ncbi:Lipin/Ned1/Smp2-domain-containing protein [Mucor mucedo]|uniref:Lipin/Ned1/Smp2-domain-containing protein n=1 Tax=Mucor mucedo TaxID=29922 RepID=UPI00221EA088|nr:Lipin/Ned1/Smp2-domain-containing protein [Mucor mucedo]KAI7890488.1 Lipin/Ned1/Smp2-domain-containing protein [Mucor mucedo]